MFPVLVRIAVNVAFVQNFLEFQFSWKFLCTFDETERINVACQVLDKVHFFRRDVMETDRSC